MQNFPKRIPDPFITVEESLTKASHLKKTIFDFEDASTDPMEYFLQMNLPCFFPNPFSDLKPNIRIKNKNYLNKKPPEEPKLQKN
jgi:hypothetical protein